MTLQICTKCNQSKDQSLFYRLLDGYETQCKECRNLAHYEARIKRRKNNNLKVRAVGNRQSRLLKEQGLKHCPGCKLVRTLSEFSTTNVRGKVSSHCKECIRKFNDEYSLTEEAKLSKHNHYLQQKRLRRDILLQKEYGISIEDYERMLVEQNNVCAICGGTNKNNRALAVDHDHSTGQIRQLLCNRCNPAVGFLLEDPEFAEKVILYIKKWKNNGLFTHPKPVSV